MVYRYTNFFLKFIEQLTKNRQHFLALEGLGEPKAIAALETGGQAWAEKETHTKVESGPWVCGLRKLGDELFTNTRPYAGGGPRLERQALLQFGLSAF